MLPLLFIPRFVCSHHFTQSPLPFSTYFFPDSYFNPAWKTNQTKTKIYNHVLLLHCRLCWLSQQYHLLNKHGKMLKQQKSCQSLPALLTNQRLAWDWHYPASKYRQYIVYFLGMALTVWCQCAPMSHSWPHTITCVSKVTYTPCLHYRPW